MTAIAQAASEFLADKRIAVTGVSRNAREHGANFVYQRLRERGYEVFPVNPNASEVEGMHRAFGGGSVSPRATQYGREHGVTVIDGGCPLMFGDCADGGHKVMRVVFSLTGAVPRQV